MTAKFSMMIFVREDSEVHRFYNDIQANFPGSGWPGSVYTGVIDLDNREQLEKYDMLMMELYRWKEDSFVFSGMYALCATQVFSFSFRHHSVFQSNTLDDFFLKNYAQMNLGTLLHTVTSLDFQKKHVREINRFCD